MQELLTCMDDCGQHGWMQTALIQTRSLFEFQSHIPVLRLAQRLFRMGLAPRNPDQSKGAASVPDVYVDTPSGPLVLEVYMPRDWLGSDRLTEELCLHLSHLDIPFDYCAEFFLKPSFNSNPWDVANRYICPKTRAGTIDSIAALVAKFASLPSGHHFESLPDPQVPTGNWEIAVWNQQRSTSHLPLRDISYRTSVTGHRPEGMFAHFLKTRLVQKLKKRQCGGDDTGQHRILFIPTEGFAYHLEFDGAWYFNEFRQALCNLRLLTSNRSVDAIAFGSSYPFEVKLLACLGRHSEEVAGYLGVTESSRVLWL
ncbi:MAG: hypothetical protein JNK87_24440 [Bryobacterales bacterium]|nr:hypothetical protein [Bryobacterales bacterium]